MPKLAYRLISALVTPYIVPMKAAVKPQPTNISAGIFATTTKQFTLPSL